MAKAKRSKTFKILITLIIVLGVFEVAAFGALAFYISDYERADADAAAALKSTARVTVIERNDWIEFRPAGETADADSAADTGADGTTGIVFYPGGKVEAEAYAPLMQEFAKQGYFCAVVKMPLRLAVLDSNAAKDVRDAHPEIADWFIGGHSLGGAMAAKYAAISDFDGLFLLAAYSTTDMSDKDIPVASVYGDKDGVLNMDDYAANKANLPADTAELVIEGGNHSQFGSYGLQERDKKASIAADEQRTLAVEFVLNSLR